MGKTVLLLGAGIAGHTAAMTLRKPLAKQHRVVVVSPAPRGKAPLVFANARLNFAPRSLVGPRLSFERLPRQRANPAPNTIPET